MVVELHEFLVPHLQELSVAEGFADGCTLNASVTGAGDGFMGLMLRVNIVGTRAGAADQLSVIVKMPPDSPDRRSQFSAIPIFEREAEFYTKFCPMLMEFQRERGVTDETDGFFAVPKCYKVIADPEHQNYAMFLEDLQVGGYRMFDKLATIDLAHVTLFIKNLARYHALSFAIRDQRPDLLNEIRQLKDIFNEKIIGNNPHFEMVIHGALDRAIGAMKPSEEYKIEKLQKLKAEALETFENCASHERCEPFGVLMHGDCWNNNMMYRYEEDGTPGNIRLLDFQLLRYGSPANDLSYFLFTSTDTALRAQHYETLLQIYHQTLTDFVTRLGSDGPKAFAYKDLKGQLKKFGRYGLLMACLVVQIIVMDKKDLPNMDDVAKDLAANGMSDANMMTKAMTTESSEKAYNERIRGVVSDVIRLGYY